MRVCWCLCVRVRRYRQVVCVVVCSRCGVVVGVCDGVESVVKISVSTS